MQGRTAHRLARGLVLAMLLLPWVLGSGGCKDEKATATPLTIGSPASGTLDGNFDPVGSDGIVVVDGGHGADFAHSLAIDAAGNVVVTGQTTNAAGDLDMGLWRFTTYGAADAGFGSAGQVSDDGGAPGANEEGRSVALDVSGAIVVTGTTEDGGAGADLAVWRFTTTGSRDPAFDGDGIAVFNSGGTKPDGGEGLAIDLVGNVLVAGRSGYVSAGTDDMTIWRLNANGALDTAGFAPPNGYVVANAGFGHDAAAALVLGGAGTLVTAGQITDPGPNANAGVWRFTPGGAADPTFDTDGVVHLDGGNGGDRARAIGVDSQGRYLVAGYVTNAAGNRDIAIWRLEPDGALDLTFGTAGLVTFDGEGKQDDEARAIALRPTRSAAYLIYVTGFVTQPSGALNMVLVRFADTGALDTAFNGSGFVTRGQDAGGSGDAGFGVVVESVGLTLGLEQAGRIVVGGFGMNAAGNADLVLWRFNP